MVIIKSAAEIEEMKKANQIVAMVLQDLEEFIKPGLTTAAIDQRAEALIRGEGAVPSFKGYGHPPFPASVCISINEAVVHGIPSEKIVIKDGDIVSVDCGAYIDGWHGDAARTFIIGEVDDKVRELVEVTEQAFWEGFQQAVPGNRLGDISAAIQKKAESHGFGVVRELTGHGIGRDMHEEPNVLNYGRAGRGLRLQPGMVLAVEPMITLGSKKVRLLDDNWTIVTADGKQASHYENTFAITEDGPIILTALP
ncbi:MAG: type I methionyl aminopeptidase [Fastidiosipilaceae bacterium]|jgi:methionyl aminopeptidase|nr:type I methionyl aminopeptidase [Clostridiaceae bacterium]